MGNVLTIKGEKPAKQAPARKYSYYLEDPRAQFLFVGIDERGKHAYFFQMNITGLRQRVFGPFSTRSRAIESFDAVLQGALEAFCEIPHKEDSNHSKGNNGMEHIAFPEHLTPVPMG